MNVTYPLILVLSCAYSLAGGLAQGLTYQPWSQSNEHSGVTISAESKWFCPGPNV